MHRLRAQLHRKFLQLGVDVTQPGFYDHPAFRERAREEPRLWDDYARYVFALEPGAAYLRRARPVIEHTARFLHAELVRDGQLGACVGASRTLARFLERQGIWNVAVTGMFHVRLPDGSARNFGPLTTRDVAQFAGHTWVYAPPFVVVDVTVRQQFWSPGARAQLPDLVLSDTSQRAELRGPEFFSDPALALFQERHARAPTFSDVMALAPEIAAAVRLFPALTFPLENNRFTYVALSPTFQHEPLELARHFVLNGQTPLALYHQMIAGWPEPQTGELPMP